MAKFDVVGMLRQLGVISTHHGRLRDARHLLGIPSAEVGDLSPHSCTLRSPYRYSFGGLIALEYALRYPERLSRLILLDTAPTLIGGEHPSSSTSPLLGKQ